MATVLEPVSLRSIHQHRKRVGDGAAAAQQETATSLPKAEQRKLDSDYLREPLLSELANDLPNFSEDALQILKFHGSYQQDDRDKREKGKDKT